MHKHLSEAMQLRFEIMAEYQKTKTEYLAKLGEFKSEMHKARKLLQDRRWEKSFSSGAEGVTATNNYAIQERKQ